MEAWCLTPPPIRPSPQPKTPKPPPFDPADAQRAAELEWWSRASPWAHLGWRSVDAPEGWECPALPGESGGSPSSLLDTPELNPEPGVIPGVRLNPAIPADPVAFRHADFQALRARHRRALVAAGAGARRLERFDGCGSKAWVYQLPGPEPDFVIAGSACHDRYCPTCQRARASIVVANLAPIIKPGIHRFVTLTLRSDAEHLGEQIDRLYSCFQQLRALPFWKRHVSGGVAFTELKPNRSRLGWHVHLHLIVEGTFLPHRDLSACWHAITGDSYIVDVKAIDDSKAVGSYVTKYLTKPIPESCLDSPRSAAEVIKALHHRRLSMTFGSFRGLKLTAAPETRELIPICSWARLRADAAAGQPDAVAILNILWKKAHHRRLWHKTPVPSLDQSGTDDLFSGDGENPP